MLFWFMRNMSLFKKLVPGILWIYFFNVVLKEINIFDVFESIVLSYNVSFKCALDIAKESLTTICNSIILPTTEYAINVWGWSYSYIYMCDRPVIRTSLYFYIYMCDRAAIRTSFYSYICMCDRAAIRTSFYSYIYMCDRAAIKTSFYFYIYMCDRAVIRTSFYSYIYRCERAAFRTSLYSYTVKPFIFACPLISRISRISRIVLH